MFAFIPLLVLLLTAEAGLRIIHFNVVSNDKLATAAAAKYLKQKVLLFQASQQADDAQAQLIKNALYTDIGKPLLSELKHEYEDNFHQLAETARQIDSRLIVLYLPVYHDTAARPGGPRLRSFYRDLARQEEAIFIDLTERLSRYDSQDVYLLPEDAHFSRYGNRLIASALRNELVPFSGYRSSHSFSQRATLLGDLKPNQNKTWIYNPRLPYQVVTNSQGLRSAQDITSPKTKQRVIFLGDSYTFGAYVGNHATYPELLARQYPDIEPVNAGVAGYTITDEASLFAKRAKYSEPDITVLQVSENDMEGLLSFKKNLFDRQEKVYSLSPAEQKLLQKISDREHN